MQEEMEEGHFDKEGTYIFGERDKDEVKDHWLDNIDWVKVNTETAAAKAKIELTADPEELKSFNHITCYKEMLGIIRSGETVLKCLKRLGGNKIQTASERWKKKKQSNGESSKSDDSNKEQLIKLTELADSILSNMGNMDIYQETFESIRHKIKLAEAPSVEAKFDADQDMFGDDFDSKTKSEASSSEPAMKKVKFNEDDTVETTTDANQVQWQFKWENKEDAEIHGPHSSQEMQKWVNDGYFNDGVWVKRTGQEGEFHNSKRVDFELYL